MIDAIFTEMKELDLIDWGVILLGCKGLPIGHISSTMVSDYAVDQLEKIGVNDKGFTLICELAICIDISDGTQQVLVQLCELFSIDITFSKQKWLVFCLLEYIKDLSSDPLYGLLELNNFWIEWGDVENSPNIIQGVNNDITPENFYTKESYERVLMLYRSWVCKQMHLFKNRAS